MRFDLFQLNTIIENVLDKNKWINVLIAHYKIQF
jgi:hypothetical protein